jgi:hypothetical protein
MAMMTTRVRRAAIYKKKKVVVRCKLFKASWKKIEAATSQSDKQSQKNVLVSLVLVPWISSRQASVSVTIYEPYETTMKSENLN